MADIIDKETKEKLDGIADVVSSAMDLQFGSKVFSYSEIETIIWDLMNSMKFLTEKLPKNEKEYIVKKVKSIKPFKMGPVYGLALDNNRDWFTSNKEMQSDYFDRYYRYLKRDKGFTKEALDQLSHEVLDPLMNQLGNPNADEFSRQGLVMGDVQSGKTMTYTGLINKAVDAGYKLIIVLTGTVESLRKQTQERLDLGFTGFDSDLQIGEKKTKFVGVGLDKLTKTTHSFAASFTMKRNDFSKDVADTISLSLDHINGPAIMVTKKNVHILDRIYEWLHDNHNITDEKKITHPLLLIDDEADYASIDTKKHTPEDEDVNPTKINGGIRKILNLFKKYTYVGFTATPFANIFINPDMYDSKMYGKDLFPHDFIYTLIPSPNYIGGKDIFLDEGRYHSALIHNDDCHEIKKKDAFTTLPNSLKEAIVLFTLSNAIRDLKGDTTTHRAMLINISVLIEKHQGIYEKVKQYYDSVLDAYYNFANIVGSDNEIIKYAKEVFEKEYDKQCDFSWEAVKTNLYYSNEKVEFRIVNSDNDMIDYNLYPNGARVIFVGGFSLSRGLTLEGLCISYFCRSSKTYDALFQMGRWFGYRPNYEELFRIYMSKGGCEWYATITVAMEELKQDLLRMKAANKRPDEFGLRIRNDKSKLKITSANKLRGAEDGYKTVIGFGEIIPTPDIYKDVNTNISNSKNVIDRLANYCKINNIAFRECEVTHNHIISGVPYSIIKEIIEHTTFSPANDMYEKDSLLAFLENPEYNSKYFQEWDVAFIEGEKKINTNIYNIDELGITIHKPLKKFDLNYNYIRMQMGREQLHNPIDTATGLTKEQRDVIVKYYKENVFDIEHKNDPEKTKIVSIPAKYYLRETARRPILMLYYVELSENELTDEEQKIKENFDNNEVAPFGLAFGIPLYEEKMSSQTLYKINVIAQRERRRQEGIFEEEEM